MRNFFVTTPQTVDRQTIRQQMFNVDAVQDLNAIDLLKVLSLNAINDCNDLTLIKAWRNKLCEHPYAEGILYQFFLKTTLFTAGCFTSGAYFLTASEDKTIGMLVSTAAIAAVFGFGAKNVLELAKENECLTSSLDLLNNKIFELGSREDKIKVAGEADNYSFSGVRKKIAF